MEVAQIERLIRISKEHPLLPEKFVPWQAQLQEDQVFLPEKLNSLQGLPIYDTLTWQQKFDLCRHESVQVMYSYSWSEGLFCLFMNRYVLNLPPDHLEYRFLLRELIEEWRHQDMFAMGVAHMEGKPIRPSYVHNLVGKFTARFMPADCVFLSALAVEMIADMYGDHFRKDPQVAVVLQKISELHNIEEARHILFTQALLKRYTQKAGFLRRSAYSIIVLLNVYFMRTLYVKKEIFERIGLANPDQVYKQAYANYRQKFAQHCLHTNVDFVADFRGFNWLTRPLWKLLLNAHDHAR